MLANAAPEQKAIIRPSPTQVGERRVLNIHAGVDAG